MSQAMEMVTDPPSSQELEHRLSTLRTSLSAIERAIVRYEDLIEDCRMQEEAHQEEEISHEQEEEETTDGEMVDEEEHGDPEPSGPHEEADTEGPSPLDPVKATEGPPPLDPVKDTGPTPLAPVGDAVSPEEAAFLMQPAFQPGDPAAGSHSLKSEASTVLGEMAELSLTSPSQPEPAEDETPP